ncbi:unnamed protein product [Eruca vesicaria subsp. sativa]|uniref:Uncharacterized protein n=1 Tax=Eruca vesicaria subsp. sativa TaxID=29727 RepID=A0ABC8KZ90_ERUVS|nr:unnamed protein product [Eruca vesicaria subsp. sativa]
MSRAPAVKVLVLDMLAILMQQGSVNIATSSHQTERDAGVRVEIPNPTRSVRNAATQTNPHSLNLHDVSGAVDQLTGKRKRGTMLTEDDEGEHSGGSGVQLPDGDGGDGSEGERDATPAPHSPGGHAGVEISSDEGLQPDLVFPNPTFSLGLTQEERAGLDKVVTDCITAVNKGSDVAGSEVAPLEQEEIGIGCRKSKRQKQPPPALVGNYECDKRFLNLGRQAYPESYMSGGNIDYSAKFSVLLDKMKTPFSIGNDGWTLESNEMFEIVERSAPTSAKVSTF